MHNIMRARGTGIGHAIKKEMRDAASQNISDLENAIPRFLSQNKNTHNESKLLEKLKRDFHFPSAIKLEDLTKTSGSFESLGEGINLKLSGSDLYANQKQIRELYASGIQSITKGYINKAETAYYAKTGVKPIYQKATVSFAFTFDDFMHAVIPLGCVDNLFFRKLDTNVGGISLSLDVLPLPVIRLGSWGKFNAFAEKVAGKLRLAGDESRHGLLTSRNDHYQREYKIENPEQIFEALKLGTQIINDIDSAKGIPLEILLNCANGAPAKELPTNGKIVSVYILDSLSWDKRLYSDGEEKLNLSLFSSPYQWQLKLMDYLGIKCRTEE